MVRLISLVVLMVEDDPILVRCPFYEEDIYDGVVAQVRVLHWYKDRNRL